VIAQARRIAQNLGVTIDGEIQALRQSGSLNAKPIELQNLKLKAEPEGPRGPEENQAPRSGGIVPVLAGLALAGGVAAGSFALWQQWQGRQLQAIQVKQAQVKKAQANQIQVQVKSDQTKPVQTKQTLTKQTSTKKASTKQDPAPSLSRPQTEATSITLSSVNHTWLEVKTLKGKQLFRGDFKGRNLFPLNEGLRVLAGRPDLVLVQVGSTAARPLGSISEVQWQTFAAPKAPAPSGTAHRPPEPHPGKRQGSNAPG
jgi:hypothetical protein